jgi:hypothetical protein
MLKNIAGIWATLRLKKRCDFATNNILLAQAANPNNSSSLFLEKHSTSQTKLTYVSGWAKRTH